MGTTIPYQVNKTFSASEVMLKPAAPGTGVIAGGAVRAVVEAAGIRDVLSKSFGHSELNTVTATISALKELNSPDVEAARRNRPLADLVGPKAAARIAAAMAEAPAPTEPERPAFNRRERGDRGDRGGDRRGGGNSGGGRGGRSDAPRGDRGTGGPGPVARQPFTAQPPAPAPAATAAANGTSSSGTGEAQ